MMMTTGKKTRKRMAKMDRESTGNPEANETIFVEESDAAEQTIADELCQFVDDPDSRQKKIMVELRRLHHSLRGPEVLLDRGNYSRPIPPAAKTSAK
jgi:hypothetical protein